jgi:type IV pilus assembly protein PilB
MDQGDEKQLKRLEDIKKKEEEDLVQILAQAKYGLPYINLASVVIENEAMRQVSEKEAQEWEVAPFKLLGKNIHIAIRTPNRPEVAMLKERLEGKGLKPVFYMASKASLEKVWERYGELSFAEATKAGSLDISGETLVALGENIKTIKDVEPTIKEAEKTTKTRVISKIMEVVLAGAISTGCSDIHIEPEEKEVRLRYRLDGVLQDVMFFGHEKYKLLNSRIKLLSGMKLVTNIAQDGRFSIFIKGIEINMRVSTIPGAYGESIVMRILDPRSIRAKLEDLGIEPRLFSIIEAEIAKPNGLILVTGPTGSGKTTTLYAFLRRVYSAEIKIITIEDPIEYHLEGITQTQVDHKKGYTFLEGLRSSLRQDPDVIMVGEIRDDETAKIAVESSLTGHIVFSTLHTNNAAGVIPRLIDLSVNPKILVSALSLSIAQRLVRKLCTNCKKGRKPTEYEENLIRKILKGAEADGKNLSFYNIKSDQELVLYEPVGCADCNFIGYKGRLGIFEAIKSDENIEKIITQNPSEREIMKVAKKQGILDMREDGVVKIVSGITSFEEVKSVVSLEEE